VNTVDATATRYREKLRMSFLAIANAARTSPN